MRPVLQARSLPKQTQPAPFYYATDAVEKLLWGPFYHYGRMSEVMCLVISVNGHKTWSQIMVVKCKIAHEYNNDVW
jgi:hypothetical protein